MQFNDQTDIENQLWFFKIWSNTHRKVFADLQEVREMEKDVSSMPCHNAAIGYEYNRVRANTGNAQFGGTVQFSIPSQEKSIVNKTIYIFV